MRHRSAGFHRILILMGAAACFVVIALVFVALAHRPGTKDPSEIAGGHSVAEATLPLDRSHADDARVSTDSGVSAEWSAPGTPEAGRSGDLAPSLSSPSVPVGGLIPVANKERPARGQSTRALAVPGKSIVSILEGVDMSDPQARAGAEKEMRDFEAAQRAAVEKKARLLGVPLRIDGPGHKVSILHDFLGDEPVYRTTKNANAAISTGANLLVPAPYSLNGSGIKVGVWDGGSVRNTHQELTGRVTKIDSTTPVDAHATHVAGTIGASGVQPNAKGMAPQITIDSYDWDSDYAEMTAAGAATSADTSRIPLSNHSYGFDAVTADMGRYETEAAAVDAVAASLPYYLPFWAAGNEQDLLTAKGGYQSITFNGLAKNLMTVGAVNDAVSGGVRTPSNGIIAYFSSLGPCDDGRIKPDVVANGIDVYSCVSSSNTAYDGTYDGTSMATPNALGSAALLVQLYAREFSGQRMRASMLKGLIIHTADDRGNPGPDYTYGWGLMNVKAAADLVLAHKASLASPKMIEGTVTSAANTATHTFTWDGTSPIRATLCWTDPAGAVQSDADSRTPNLKHNLDAKITAPDGTTVVQPFVMPFVGNWSTASMATAATRGKNNVDNVEQVYLAIPTQAGTYTVTVSLDGALTTASQAYSLILTGGSNQQSNPPPSVVLTSPAGGAEFLSGASVTVSATASDLTLGGSPGTVAQVEFFNGTASLGVDSSSPYSINWTPPAPGSYTLTAKATDSEGAAATSAASTITVFSGDGSPLISSFTPTGGTAGAPVVLTGSNFTGATAVRFNGTDAVFTVNSSGQITATVPATATTGVITVVNGYGTGASASVFTVLEAPVLISQIYGAGGNTGATFNRDYVELYNRSDAAVDLTGWSVQYASSSGTSWQAAALSGSIAPGKYFLLGLGSGTSGAALPTVDASGSIAMSATEGKIALRNTTTPFSGVSPAGASGLQDFVGYGAANASEGSPAPSPSTTTSIYRADGGATDSGDNAADFVAAAPSPRNSSSGAPVLPVITSPSTATGTVNGAFIYQIAATNTPTSYGADGLPDGLSVNTSTGAVTGTPTAAGTTSATITATNGAGTASATLAITINPASGGATTVIFSENMGTPSATTAIATNIFQNSGLTFTGTADVRNTTPSSGYTGASAGGNVFVTNSDGKFFEISDINTAGYSDLALSFGHHKSTTAGNNELVVEVSSDGSSYSPLQYSRATGSGTATWTMINPTGVIPSTPNLHIRFRQSSNDTQFRIDDVKLTGTASSAATPVISASGSLSATDSTYGSPSATPASFTVAGTDMTAGILVTPPAGFEVSQTAGGASGYAATQLVGAAGSIPATTVYLRLAAGVSAGSYSGNVTLNSAGAVPVTLATAISEVRKKLITVTAGDLTKPFGETLTLGSTETGFTATGLVGSETIGSVTLAASGGTAANDTPGIYQITPSAAAGGTFNPDNYDIDYVAGALTVLARSYADWLLEYPTLALIGVSDDPDADGQVNLMEYFAGTHPGTANPAPVTVEFSGGVLTMTYRRAKGITGVGGMAGWSADLTESSWSSAGVAESAEDMGDHERVTATLAVPPGTPRRFMRLQVSQP